MNLFRQLWSEYGLILIKSMSMENMDYLENKISKHQNHRVFALHCNNENILPPPPHPPTPFVIKMPHTDEEGQGIVEKAQKDWLEKGWAW